jgi:hypothetical protein
MCAPEFVISALSLGASMIFNPDLILREIDGCGATAHGHPIGATGAVVTTRLLHSMRRDHLRRGMVAMYIGGVLYGSDDMPVSAFHKPMILYRLFSANQVCLLLGDKQ